MLSLAGDVLGGVNWEVLRIVVTGFGAVFIIMLILAGVTAGMGKIVQRLQKSKGTDEKPS